MKTLKQQLQELLEEYGSLRIMGNFDKKGIWASHAETLTNKILNLNKEWLTQKRQATCDQCGKDVGGKQCEDFKTITRMNCELVNFINDKLLEDLEN